MLTLQVRRTIRITNPLTDVAFTSRQRAKRYIAAGQAVWHDPGKSIRFLRSNHQSASVQRVVDETIRSYDYEVKAGELATVRQLIGLPVTSPAVALGMGRRKGAGPGLFYAVSAA